jgi:hypothetical protein
MNAYVEECRREWKRLGVPPGLAEEMAAELEADLAEAEADGVSAAEMLGESDPRRFAATWARERGLVAEAPPKKSRKGLWIAVTVVFLLMVFFVVALSGLAFATGGGSSGSPNQKTPVIARPITVPDFVGMKACAAVRAVLRSGLDVHVQGHSHGYACDAIVSEQAPAAGRVVHRYGRHSKVTLLLGRAKR